MVSKSNVKSIRPGYGLHPKYYEKIMGMVINQKLKKGTPLKWEYLEESSKQSQISGTPFKLNPGYYKCGYFIIEDC